MHLILLLPVLREFLLPFFFGLFMGDLNALFLIFFFLGTSYASATSAAASITTENGPIGVPTSGTSTAMESSSTSSSSSESSSSPSSSETSSATTTSSAPSGGTITVTASV
jgi:hypothetical protein